MKICWFQTFEQLCTSNYFLQEAQSVFRQHQAVFERWKKSILSRFEISVITRLNLMDFGFFYDCNTSTSKFSVSLQVSSASLDNPFVPKLLVCVQFKYFQTEHSWFTFAVKLGVCRMDICGVKMDQVAFGVWMWKAVCTRACNQAAADDDDMMMMMLWWWVLQLWWVGPECRERERERERKRDFREEEWKNDPRKQKQRVKIEGGDLEKMCFAGWSIWNTDPSHPGGEMNGGQHWCIMGSKRRS